MQSDRELLEAAAKAAGIEIHESDDGTLQRRPAWAVYHYVQGQPYTEVRWDPLRDDGQALRLAVKLKIPLQFPDWQDIARTWGREDDGEGFYETALQHNGDLAAATRRAIVRAAASQGGVK